MLFLSYRSTFLLTTKHPFRRPILAQLLKNRPTCATITGATMVHLSLVMAGLPSWRSPFHSVFGIPDPGCGLSRAIVALLRADWTTAVTFHAFAPLFVIALILIALSVVLPRWLRDKAAAWVAELERRTGLTAILLVGLVVYWLARLLLIGNTFINLINGNN